MLPIPKYHPHKQKGLFTAGTSHLTTGTSVKLMIKLLVLQ